MSAQSKSWLAHLDRALEFVVIGTLALLTGGALLDTLLWSLLQVSVPTLGEIQGLLLVWFVLLSAAWAVPRGLHLAIDWLPAEAPKPIAFALDLIVRSFIAAFGVGLVVYGTALSRAVRNTLPATGLPAWVPYAALPVAGALIALFALTRRRD